jgi:hypothetical protein
MWRFHVEGLPDFKPPLAYRARGSQVWKALYMEPSPIHKTHQLQKSNYWVLSMITLESTTHTDSACQEDIVL